MEQKGYGKFRSDKILTVFLCLLMGGLFSDNTKSQDNWKRELVNTLLELKVRNMDLKFLPLHGKHSNCCGFRRLAHILRIYQQGKKTLTAVQK